MGLVLRTANSLTNKHFVNRPHTRASRASESAAEMDHSSGSGDCERSGAREVTPDRCIYISHWLPQSDSSSQLTPIGAKTIDAAER